mmetsp:Transcript_29185/g.81642  ORF Transcript_29185/g.81642 Transcript_29185/m.81642 type:complete len:350 (+) Transcript_29185:51-1100(+)
MDSLLKEGETEKENSDPGFGTMTECWYANSNPKMAAELEAIRKMRKQMKKAGAKEVYVGNPIAESEFGFPRNFHLKLAATSAFQGHTPAGSKDKSSRGNFKGERAYKAYYTDLVGEDREVWLALFENPDNVTHAEHTTGIMGTYATLLRQRGALDECEAVMEIYREVLVRYERVVRQNFSFDPSTMQCMEALKYKFHLIEYNVNMQRHRFRDNIAVWRTICDYELRTMGVQGLGYTQQLLMVTVALQQMPTPEVLRAISDEEVMSIIMLPVVEAGGVEALFKSVDEEMGGNKAKLNICPGCGKQEDVIGVFKSCANCRVAKYCSRACQKSDWSVHKRACRKKGATKQKA